MLMIYWLGEGSGDPWLLGGKAANLDRLARLGVRTPPGFCLTTDAYRRYLEAYGLESRIAALCAALPDESARRDLASLASTHPLPEDLRGELEEALKTLAMRLPRTALLAVRSSAVGEDAAAASFAGQHESMLGVRFDGVESGIRTCWASLWSARAVAYRLHRHLGLEGAAMAVVVQALVPAEASAVAFTRNPVTGRDDEILLNAAWGLGEAIVSGDVTPDEIVLDKATLRVRFAQPGEKRFRVVARVGGGTETVATTEEGLALDEEALRALGELCREVERAFGEPVDIEAASAGGQWYLVQARPITTK
jgi:pyruvate,water dikinase